ncbi:MAG TPA: phospho-N-acetylmuramoyl-pentapeptide-transferase [Chloroflexia bacterium]|nr:phospho-N-acetylmuramoyl-pentapeptide-transferase [Chloroflexia bacterium]
MHVWNDLITLAASHYEGGAYGHAVAGAHSTGLLDLLVSILTQQATPTVTASATVEAAQGAPVGPEAMTPIVMIRGLALGVVGFVLGVLVGKPVINWLRDRGIGKSIRVEGSPGHQVKTGTPTMGGLIFLVPLVLIIVVFMDLLTFKSLLLPLGIVISCGILGGVDDLMSTVGRNRGGMTARFKMAWLLAISTIAAFILYFPLGLHTVSVPFVTEPISIGLLYIPIAIFVIAGCANAVNFTDGLDSLAGGTSAIAFMSYGIIAFLQRQPQIVYLCFAVAGVLLAFLWFNAYPAMAFMGDAGSLTLGALLAVCALMTGQWLLLPLVGIVFVAETVSDILQILYFKLTGGKRLFKRAPVHIHFEMIGWSETQVTMRFWMVSMVGGMLGVALALL